MLKWLKGVIGESSEKKLEKLQPLVDRTNALEEEVAPLSDAELRGKTDQFRQRLADGETLDDILPDAFAVVREMAKRRLGERHFDVQLLGGIVLHRGDCAEMKTGEGKTLVATLPLYLNGLEGKGAHLVTVNDYLAKRDTTWMGTIYHNLGLSVACLQHDSAYIYDPGFNADNPSLRHLRPVPRREAYLADITYGTNNEFGFDYLRDNMVVDLSRAVQRPEHPHNYAIVDEVDNILIDEARTPLIISGPAEETEEVYRMFARLVPRLQLEVDYTIDHKTRSVSLTEEGVAKLEKWMNIKNIYDPENYRLTRFLEAALKAHALYQRDHHYVVKDGEVVIVDEFTGRLMFGRRWSDGLHQAVEAKEGVRVQRESVTYATITLQNYFRLYEKLAGMTGTAYTEREEFHTIYRLDVIPIPTHRPMVRQDNSDFIYRTPEAKFRAVVKDIEEAHATGRPVLVGTVSIEISEHVADLLKRRSQCSYSECGQYHDVCPLKEPQVLNAKHHEREAQIIAQAGRSGAVTIATNMAGRGVDIILGGNPGRLVEEIHRKKGIDPDTAPPEELERIRREAREMWQSDHDKVVEADGLHIIGTERHEARRIDNQLRGRAGRQGDPGSSRFFVSFGDDVMRRFAPEWVGGMMGRLGMDEDMPLESRMASKAIESAQTKVEGHNFDIRKHVVEYDDVMNTQRDLIYTERQKILEGTALKANIQEMITEEINEVVGSFVADQQQEERDIKGLLTEMKAIMPLPPHFTQAHFADVPREAIVEELLAHAQEEYEAKEQKTGPDNMRTLERLVMLGTIDRLWVGHLTALDEMRQGIGLAGYGGQDPLIAFKREAHDMWEQLMTHIRRNIARRIYHVTLSPQTAPAPRRPAAVAAQAGRRRAAAAGRPEGKPPAAPRKVGRNDPCPCGSGLKYKKCCGRSV
ncbi:MAG: preprotein translocase subunit SecA [Dehalococcoidia bacterium SM23_28_2]|nr:MAG: preprotein translocase subunit SecA [Dehalococcoidia bacterium SM23_28_2]